jgi:hypothetical protein
LEPDLPSNIDMDDIDRIGELETAGEKFVQGVDWTAMLAGCETPCRVSSPRSRAGKA